jgi:hypothetical protein
MEGVYTGADRLMRFASCRPLEAVRGEVEYRREDNGSGSREQNETLGSGAEDEGEREGKGV